MENVKGRDMPLGMQVSASERTGSAGGLGLRLGILKSCLHSSEG